MNFATKHLTESAIIANTVHDFYNQHPYPPPINNLDSYQKRWQEYNRRRAEFHLFWPNQPYCEGGTILVAGCGTSQAAKYALRQPGARVIGIDFSETSIKHSLQLKDKYNLKNLELKVLPIEQVGELQEKFDKIICTGVLHHLPDPARGLCALVNVLKANGAMHLMLYAPYGRIGIYMLQELCQHIEVIPSRPEIEDLARLLHILPHDHPLQSRLHDSPDFQNEVGLADALLHPQDRAYSVPQVFELLEGCGLKFGRWLRQAPYLPMCSLLAKTAFASRINQLTSEQQYTVLELFRGTMARHSFIAHHAEQVDIKSQVCFDRDEWQEFIPIRMPETILVQEKLPANVAAVLINQTHTFTDLYLPINKVEKDWFDAIDGNKSITEIMQKTHPGAGTEIEGNIKDLFERLWRYDQVVFDTSQALFANRAIG